MELALFRRPRSRGASWDGDGEWESTNKNGSVMGWNEGRRKKEERVDNQPFVKIESGLFPAFKEACNPLSESCNTFSGGGWGSGTEDVGRSLFDFDRSSELSD